MGFMVDLRILDLQIIFKVISVIVEGSSKKPAVRSAELPRCERLCIILERCVALFAPFLTGDVAKAYIYEESYRHDMENLRVPRIRKSAGPNLEITSTTYKNRKYIPFPREKQILPQLCYFFVIYSYLI